MSNYISKHDSQLGQAVPARKTVASEVMEELEKLTAYAEELSRNVDARLTPIMNNQETDVANKHVGDAKVGQRPPFFAVLSSHISSIRSALDNIRASLSRVEL